MIHGQFGTNGELFFEVDLITTNGFSFTIDAMLDTGITEFLAVNKQDLDGLDWVYIRRDELRTAQGEAAFDIYFGKVMLDGQEYEIPVFAGDVITEILLGSQWLKILLLVVNYQANLLTLG